MPELASSLRELVDRAVEPVTPEVAISRGRRHRRRRRAALVGAVTLAVVCAAGVTTAVWPRAQHSLHTTGRGNVIDRTGVPAGLPQPWVMDGRLIPNLKLWQVRQAPSGAGGNPQVVWRASYFSFGPGHRSVRGTLDILLWPQQVLAGLIDNSIGAPPTIRQVTVGNTTGELRVDATPGAPSLLKWPIAPGLAVELSATLPAAELVDIASNVRLAPDGKSLEVSRVPRGYELVDVGPGMEPYGDGWEITYAAPPLRKPAYTVQLSVLTSSQRALSALHLPRAHAVDIHGHVGVLIGAPSVGDIKLTWDIDPTTRVTVEALAIGGVGRVPVSVDTVLALARSARPVPMSVWRSLEHQLQTQPPETAAQQPTSGTTLLQDAIVTIPAVAGLPVGQAGTLLRDLGLRVAVTGTTQSIVAAVDPSPGARVAPGSLVQLTTR
jgi:hypothetical protein